jgi:DNA invertase Pin-like site-specific DNA recombinase
MQTAVGYLRVSTKEQGRSGLGLAAQRRDIEAFGVREGFAISSWYQDIQTGAGADALLLRPGLATALKEARSVRCPLIVSRLDRLSRNVHFITGLMEHRVHFIVAAFGKDCDDFVLHIYASLAEQERKLIAERCRAVAAVLKHKGEKFGFARSKSLLRRVHPLGVAAHKKATMERTEACRAHIEWALRQPGVNARPITFHAAAKMLNDRNIESCTGGRWVGQQLLIMALRLGIRHPHRMPYAVARAAVRTIWDRHPEVSGKEVLAILRREHVISTGRAQTLLRECRMAAVRRSPIQKRMGWRIDFRTPARVRVGSIWKRHPEFTAQQVLEKLGTQYSVNRGWVQRILKQCWVASGRHGKRQLHVGRRLYNDRPGRGWLT